jgi:hypothetical protein
MRGQLKILNYRVKMKRKTKFTKQSKKKIKMKRMRYIFEKITNHNYGPYDDIENKLKFEKMVKRKKKRIKVEISVNKRIYLKF